MDNAVFFDKEYNERIRGLWKRFIEGEDLEGMVRPLIYESWMRCRYWNVDHRVQKHSSIGEEEFQVLRQEESELIEVTAPIMDRIFEKTRNSECLFTFSNATGIMLETWLGKYLPDVSVSPGAYVREKEIGTSGIPTCLYTGRSVTIYGCEHYCLRHQAIVCTTSPILTESGTLRGAVSMSCSLDAYHPYNSVIIQEAAKSISEQLRLRSMVALDQMLIESFGEGVLLLASSGAVLRANKKAESLLLCNPIEEKLSADRLFSGFDIMEYVRKGKNFSNEEVRMWSSGGEARTASCIVSFTPTAGGGILTMRPLREMHAYAGKAIGSYAQYHFEDILGESPRLKACIELGRKMADSPYTVLLLGQSGTGKELFAQSIHNASSRKDKPFIAVNCGAIPRDLVQSELFGYAEGSFTGASRQGKPGKFEMADGGTIFLDEIGEMSLDAQVSLLRLLQNHEVLRIGGKMARRIDVRLIAATNRNLEEEVRRKRFREDLYYRLNVFSLHIPSLAERREDIPLLARAFLKKTAGNHPRYRAMVFAGDTMAALESHPWQGNVRELEHTIERAVFSAEGNVIQPEDLGLSSSESAPVRPETPAEAGSPAAGIPAWSGTAPGRIPDVVPEDVETLEKALSLSCGNVEKAAARLGISRTTMYVKLSRFGISARKFRKLVLHDVD